MVVFESGMTGEGVDRDGCFWAVRYLFLHDRGRAGAELGEMRDRRFLLSQARESADSGRDHLARHNLFL
jgi:hypothetical protein